MSEMLHGKMAKRRIREVPPNDQGLAVLRDVRRGVPAPMSMPDNIQVTLCGHCDMVRVCAWLKGLSWICADCLTKRVGAVDEHKSGRKEE